MEEKFGVLGAVNDGIFFTESTIPGALVKRRIHVEISRQNANLADVKRKMAREARGLGASAVMNFQYGQKAHHWLELVLSFKWDTESWHGEGDAVAP